MDNFHKWCHNAVQGLGILALWIDFGVLTQYLIGSYAPGIVIGLFIIGWALSYKDDKKD